MNVDKAKNDLVKEGESLATGSMRLAAGKEAHIIRMLIEAYSDPEGSLIREFE